MTSKDTARILIGTALYAVLANMGVLVPGRWWLLLPWLPAVLLLNALIGTGARDIPGKRLKLCRHGTIALSVFFYTLLPSLLWQGYLANRFLPDKILPLAVSLAVCVAAESILFWNGMISVYVSSVQLGIRLRIVGFLCGWIPIVNLLILGRILRVCREEVTFEAAKQRKNKARENDAVCRTRYPILLVHGVFFRDSRLLNYWGRIPKELRMNGATVFYGEHSSAASVEDSAEELTARLKRIVEKTGCEKVNIIAHSKGGLDSRCALAGEAAPYIASITTINTPHRGCGFADYLIEKVPEKTQKRVEAAYNAAASRLGDDCPDFMAAVQDLTASRCQKRDRELIAPSGVFCQSVGSQLKKARGGKFPLNFPHPFVKHFDGENDGLVAADSFCWGDKYTYLKPTGKRGISHADMIDLNRENIPGFDVREFYVELVADLKQRGL